MPFRDIVQRALSTDAPQFESFTDAFARHLILECIKHLESQTDPTWQPNYKWGWTHAIDSLKKLTDQSPFG